MREDRDPYQDPYTPNAPSASSSGGPVTNPNDPRLNDPAHANDPEVLAWLNTIYAPGGTVYNPPSPSSTWNPTEQAWNGTPDVPTGTPGPGPAGNLGSLISPFTGTFTAPQQSGLPSTPTFTPPAYGKPAPFSYAAFKGPDAQSVLNDPGYQFRLGQGEQALQQSAAAKGTLNGGATQKAVLGYGQDYASNEFNNVWNRDLTEYNTNRQGAYNDYITNYQTQYLDPYKFAYQGAQDAFAPQMAGYQTEAAWDQHANDTSYANAWNQFLNAQNTYYGRQDADFDKKYKIATS